MTKKKILIIIGLLLIVISIGFNVWIGWNTLKDKIYKQGRTEIINQIILQLQNTGQVMLTSPQGNIILVPKIQ